MKLALTKSGKATSTKLEVSDDIFAVDFNEGLIHQVVMSYMAKARSGTKAQKTRAEVSGGGAKPWRQKGTGRARAGSSRSPIWVGGGRTFAAKPRDFSQKVNKKMFNAAMRSALSESIRQERFIVVDELAVSEPKTKAVLNALGDFQNEKCLIVLEATDQNILFGARNLHKIQVVVASHVSAYDIVANEKVIITKAALKVLEERLA